MLTKNASSNLFYLPGTWRLPPKSDITIERPVDQAKLFTFYCTEFAPEGSGIAPEKEDNGLVECTFCPDINAPIVKVT